MMRLVGALPEPIGSGVVLYLIDKKSLASDQVIPPDRKML